MRTEKSIVSKPLTGAPRKGHINHRKLPRTVVNQRWPVTITAQTIAGQTQAIAISGNVTDFTVKGLGLSTRDHVAPTTNISLTIHTRDGSYQLVAEVVWCYKLPSTGRILKGAQELPWRLGLSLINRGAEDTKSLEALAAQLTGG